MNTQRKKSWGKQERKITIVIINVVDDTREEAVISSSCAAE